MYIVIYFLIRMEDEKMIELRLFIPKCLILKKNPQPPTRTTYVVLPRYSSFRFVLGFLPSFTVAKRDKCNVKDFDTNCTHFLVLLGYNPLGINP